MNTTNSTTAGLLLPLHHHFPSTLHHVLRRRRWPSPPTHLTTASECTHHMLHICRSRRWDPNAKSHRAQKLGFDYEFDNEDIESEDRVEEWGGVFVEYIDSIWIFKVFRSFGWMLPFIIISLLLATGPKAFLLALSVPVWLSTFSFAVRKMWEETRNKPGQKTKAEKGSFTRSSVRSGQENTVRSQAKINVKERKQPSALKENTSIHQNENEGPSYGGWDELDRGPTELDVSSSRRADQTNGGPNKGPSEMRRSRRKMRRSKAPLLLKLLVADFPFLASWAKMF